MSLPAAAEDALQALERLGAEASVKIDQAVEAVVATSSDGAVLSDFDDGDSIVRRADELATAAKVAATPATGSALPQRGP